MTPGYARHRRTGALGDVNWITSAAVGGIVHKTQRPFTWKFGRGLIELIEFGSFNPRNKNYTPGGRVIEVR